ncbi:flagellar FlbD family protein [Thermodesulfobium narugense DSM 14796]|uniref:Flagellar FlbD family protein n=1 Tax=Thermodesulfobium narugense DSM 14796 TaxID=747365 RepID=M1E645_9BACT|nr:flagellar FlbD family protein [Thermodesulfobium narugense]AEE15417.1 flagellar FlbD family protein [Thermodesulfobium narugense DSM 14796]
MIKLTKLNDAEFILNSDLIESIESSPDTTITLFTGKKFMVKETPEEIVEKIIEYNKKVGLRFAQARMQNTSENKG